MGKVNAELSVRIRLPTNHSPEDLADLRHDVQQGMADLYLKLSTVAALALRHAMLTVDATGREGA